jgi:hypothetical protein
MQWSHLFVAKSFPHWLPHVNTYIFGINKTWTMWHIRIGTPL